MTQRIFHDLNNEQAHGHLCIRCSADFELSGIRAEPVGISATTGHEVFACPLCAPGVRREHAGGQHGVNRDDAPHVHTASAGNGARGARR